jgi:hypothetical protein
MSSQLLRVELHPRGRASRFEARVAELPGCVVAARSMPPLHSAIAAAITAALGEQGAVRLVWETPVEDWLIKMTHLEAIRVIAEIDGAPSILLTSRPTGGRNSVLPSRGVFDPAIGL